MKLNKYFKKGQALPLNTIVIAILVIIVLLVIIVFFTSSFGKSSGQVNEVSNQCNKDSVVFSVKNYETVSPIKEGDSCPKNTKPAAGMPLCCVG